jgi:uncharacterized ubiquitin-like protein YukD
VFKLSIKNRKNIMVTNQILKSRIKIEMGNNKNGDKYDIRLMSSNMVNEFTVLVKRSGNCSNENSNFLNIKVDGNLVSIV